VRHGRPAGHGHQDASSGPSLSGHCASTILAAVEGFASDEGRRLREEVSDQVGAAGVDLLRPDYLRSSGLRPDAGRRSRRVKGAGGQPTTPSERVRRARDTFKTVVGRPSSSAEGEWEKATSVMGGAVPGRQRQRRRPVRDTRPKSSCGPPTPNTRPRPRSSIRPSKK